MRYPLTGKKNTFTRGLKIHLARAGYFCLDKASFFIDDPISVLFLTGGIEHAPPFKSDNFEQRPLFFLLSLVLALPEIIV